jgi:tetratricopeptide (TPR) repeat protein
MKLKREAEANKNAAGSLCRNADGPRKVECGMKNRYARIKRNLLIIPHFVFSVPHSSRLLLLSLLLTILPILIPAQTKARRPATASKSFEQLAQRASKTREAGQYEEAIKLYQQALQSRPKWSEGWWSLGTIYYELDRYSEASKALKSLLSIDDRSGPAWALLGLSLYQLKNYQQSIACLERASVLGLGDNRELRGVTNYHLAVLFNHFEQYERAYEVWLRVLQDRGESALILQGVGLTMLGLAYLPDETPPEKRELVARTGNATCLAMTNQRETAAREYRSIIADYPSAAGVHYAYGIFLMRDSPDSALDEFRQELLLSPNHIPTLLQLAFEYLKRGEAEKGLPSAEKAVQLDPKMVLARNALGRLLLEAGQINRAVGELEAGVKLESNNPEMYYALARAYSKAGRDADAQRARAEFMRLDKLRRAQGDKH